MYHTRFKLYLFSFPCTTQSEVYKRNFSRGLFLYNLFLWIFGLSFLVSLCSLVQLAVFHSGDLMNDWRRERKKTKWNKDNVGEISTPVRSPSIGPRVACCKFTKWTLFNLSFCHNVPVSSHCTYLLRWHIACLPQQQPLTFLDRLVHSTSMTADFTYGLPEGGKISGS